MEGPVDKGGFDDRMAKSCTKAGIDLPCVLAPVGASSRPEAVIR
jgi:hypothetical protein